MGLLEAVGGKGDVGRKVGGGWDGGMINSCGGVEGEVCAELKGMLAEWGDGQGNQERGKGRRGRTPWRVR